MQDKLCYATQAALDLWVSLYASVPLCLSFSLWSKLVFPEMCHSLFSPRYKVFFVHSSSPFIIITTSSFYTPHTNHKTAKYIYVYVCWYEYMYLGTGLGRFCFIQMVRFSLWAGWGLLNFCVAGPLLCIRLQRCSLREHFVLWGGCSCGHFFVRVLNMCHARTTHNLPNRLPSSKVSTL